MTGQTHVYYGDGKGKTTAALGLILRASGCGMDCTLLQFLKDWNSGEVKSLEALPNVTVLRGKATGSVFVRDMTPEQLEQTRKIHNENLDAAIAAAQSGGLLVLDELLDAVQLELVDFERIRALLRRENCPESLEIVITGHREIPWIFECADYITQMKKLRHPYDNGIKARRGIEF